ncbi:CaiB/BaiF CoA transferase family protein [Brevibacterium sp. VCM10]|uniref:CaiB/BaiF CoA transferase family protein n=1 Tax=Brevibacterium sp. VCM10 TaxID=1381751 RepID=UPI00046EF181|nr:CaiB/BaiF CoA-transferase family protein [Brevibacterium sp. VCM10]
MNDGASTGADRYPGRVPPAGPLTGVKVIELAGLGPGQWGGMLLSDLGAEVLRVSRPSDVGTVRSDLGAQEGRGPAFVHDRGRRSIAIDLKSPEGRDALLDLVEEADVLFEGNRPGVTERLGIGPDDCLARNPRLVYARATGWGQDGPMAADVGHDLNYLAVSGMLSAIGPRNGPPSVPLNLLGDFGGGGALLIIGILAALLEARTNGRGQVVDAGMLDGILLLGSLFYGQRQVGMMRAERESNMLDGGAPFYAVYETADGGWMAVAPIERKFYAEFLDVLGLGSELLDVQWDTATWASTKERYAEIFRGRTRSQWEEDFSGREACVTPVLDIDEALQQPHMRARHSFVRNDGVLQPAPFPRFSRTPGRIQGPAIPAGADTRAALADWGIDETSIERLLASGAVIDNPQPAEPQSSGED